MLAWLTTRELFCCFCWDSVSLYRIQHHTSYHYITCLLRACPSRFLCRIKEEELLEPLVPSILANLDHRHSYVRRNAVLAINAIYKLPKGELLLQDAPETIEKLLRQEQVCGARNRWGVHQTIVPGAWMRCACFMLHGGAHMFAAGAQPCMFELARPGGTRRCEAQKQRPCMVTRRMPA